MKIFKIKVDDDLDESTNKLSESMFGPVDDGVTDFLHDYNINLHKSSKYMDVYQCENPNVDDIKNNNVLYKRLKEAYPNGVRFFDRIASDGSHILEIECYKDTTIPDRSLSKIPGAVRAPIKAGVTPVNEYQRKDINVNETGGKKDDRLEQLKSFENNFDETKPNVDIRRQYDDFLDTLEYRSFRLTFEKNKTTMLFTDGKDPVNADLLEKQNKMIDLFIHNECHLIAFGICSAYKDLIYDTLDNNSEKDIIARSHSSGKGITMDLLNGYPFDDNKIIINKGVGNNPSKMSIIILSRFKLDAKFDRTRYMMFSNDIHDLLIKTFSGIGIRETTSPVIKYFTKPDQIINLNAYSDPYDRLHDPMHNEEDEDSNIKAYQK